MAQRARGELITQIQGEWTFYGVVLHFFEELCENNFWRAKSTREHYMQDYENRIVPFLEGDSPRKIKDYTRQDYENAVKKISEEREMSDNRILHFNRLIYAVVELASNKGLCENLLWGTAFELPEMDDKERVRELVTLKRSLTSYQELKLYRELTSDITMKGEYYGVYLMLVAGLRDAESCAVYFGDVIESYNGSGIHVLMIYKTIESKEHRLISSGKTKNADRLIPIPDCVYHWIMKRKEYVASQLGVSLDEVDFLPIACRRGDYKALCIPSDIADAARILFSKIGLQSRVLAYMDYELEFEKSPVIAKEKDPTAYLLRRNFATQMAILGLEEAEIQYVIGHDIVNLYETRNEFVDIIKLRQLYTKMSKRAIFVNGKNVEIINPELINNREYRVKSISRGKIILKVTKGDSITIGLKSCEPNTNLKISSIQTKTKDIQKEEYNYEPEYDRGRTINIYSKYIRAYQEAIKTIEKETE